jgi:CRISPR-associated endonuclease/helicase Cas3
LRVGLEKLRELILREKELTAILPTGYGKTRFFKENKDLLDNLGKTIHALPLQAIVSDFYNDMKNVLKDDVGYQMALSIPDGDKRPYLSRKYMITTIDSFTLDFYGIPVHEIFRSKWHSDLALLLARTSNIILDEYHLITAIDVDDVDTEFSKIISVVEGIKCNALKKFIILTATLPRNLITTKALVLAPDGHPFVTQNMERVWGNDDFINAFSDYTRKVKTFIERGDRISNIKNILKDREGSKILIMLNHIKDVEEVADELRECLFVHGLFTHESKQEILNAKPKCLISTQVIEAGVNLSFDVLITDVAPAFSLIQRAGRILRTVYDIEKNNGEIHILVDNIEEQVKGVYNLEITNKTLEILDKMKGKECEINWRLPEKEKLDYLKLIIGIEREIKVNRENQEVSNFLNLLNNITLSPQKIIGRIDELFDGSFIRSTSLVTMIVNNETASISWPKFLKILQKAKTLEFSYILLDTYEEKSIKVDESDVIKDKPLTTLLRTIRRIRREEDIDDDLSGYVKIMPKGFKTPEELVGIEDGKYYYIKGI